MVDSHNNVNVGIVDDELCLAEIYRKMFSRRGIDVSFVARNGLQAVELFRDADPRPLVILMDQRMPAMSGIEATTKIMEIDPEVKVIFVSADIDAKEEALAAGAVEYIKKPVSLQYILTSCERLLKSKNGKEISSSSI